MKMVVLSFDDGTIYDFKFIELLNKYNLVATFNLNSGLGDFVWNYDQNTPIKRFSLEEYKSLYDKHEVASHTVTHPKLTELTKDELLKEVNGDIDNLSKIFSYPVVSFVVPFDQCNESIIEILKNNSSIKNMRIPKRSNDYLPQDQYHIHVNSWYDDPNIYDKIEQFSKNEMPNSLFVIAGHSYEFEVKNDWKKIEDLLIYLSNNKDINVVTMREACSVLFS